MHYFINVSFFIAAGDYVKFGFPLAFAQTMLAWGGITFEDGYKAAGETQNMVECVKWGTEYLVQAHTGPTTLIGQVMKRE